MRRPARRAHLLRLGRNEELQALARLRIPLMKEPALAEDRFELMRLLTLSAAESGAFELALDTAHQMVREARDEVPADALIAAYALAVCLERVGDAWQALRVIERALGANRRSSDSGSSGGSDSGSSSLPDPAVLILENGVCALSIGLFHRLNGVADAAEVRALLLDARRAGERALARQAQLKNAFYSVATAGN